MEGARGREGEELPSLLKQSWKRVCGLFLLLLCPMHVGPDVATAYADIAGTWTSKVGPAVKGWWGKSLQGEREEAWEALRLDVEALSNTAAPPTLPVGSLLVGCFQTRGGATVSHHFPVNPSEWTGPEVRGEFICAIKILSWMNQCSPSFQGFSVLKGTFPELCGSLLIFVALDDSVNFWMLQFPQLGLIVIATQLEIQQNEGKWRSALLLLAGISVDEAALSSRIFLISYDAETTRRGQWGEN